MLQDETGVELLVAIAQKVRRAEPSTKIVLSRFPKGGDSANLMLFDLLVLQPMDLNELMRSKIERTEHFSAVRNAAVRFAQSVSSPCVKS